MPAVKTAEPATAQNALPSLRELRKNVLTFALFQRVGEILPKTSWLIHFTDHPEKVIKEGFLFGEALPHRLACTWESHCQPKTHPGPGFNFAFEALDPDGAGPRWNSQLWPIHSIAQESAILFQAPGLVCDHFDGFQQVILRGSDANLTHAKILQFFEIENEGPGVKILSPQKEVLDNGLTEDNPEETIKKWIK